MPDVQFNLPQQITPFEKNREIGVLRPVNNEAALPHIGNRTTHPQELVTNLSRLVKDRIEALEKERAATINPKDQAKINAQITEYKAIREQVSKVLSPGENPKSGDANRIADITVRSNERQAAILIDFDINRLNGNTESQPSRRPQWVHLEQLPDRGSVSYTEGSVTTLRIQEYISKSNADIVPQEARTSLSQASIDYRAQKRSNEQKGNATLEKVLNGERPNIPTPIDYSLVDTAPANKQGQPFDSEIAKSRVNSAIEQMLKQAQKNNVRLTAQNFINLENLFKEKGLDVKFSESSLRTLQEGKLKYEINVHDLSRSFEVRPRIAAGR